MLKLIPYREEWVKDFEKIKKILIHSTQQKIESIEHIGSTAIPGISAKDIIDVQVGIHTFDEIDSLTQDMQNVGFENFPHITMDHAPGHEFDDVIPGWEKRFFKTPTGIRSAHIHVRLLGAKNYEYALLFRDFLRSNREAARAYEQVKRRLAEHLETNIKAYTIIKDPVCDLIMLLARKWAQENGRGMNN